MTASDVSPREYQRERADDPILRTDFLDRDRYKLRLAWSEKDLLHVSATGEQIDSSNDRPGIAYDATIREYGGDLEITPVKALRVRFSAIEVRRHAARCSSESRRTSRRPPRTTAKRDCRSKAASRSCFRG